MAAGAPRSIAGGAMLGAASRTAFVVAGGLASILVARLLGPDGSGQFAVISSLVFTLLVAGTIGIDVGVSWMLGAARWELRSALATTGLAALVLGGLGIAAGMGIYLLAEDSAFSGISAAVAITALCALPFGLLHTFFTQAAIAAERYEAAAVIGLAQSAAYVAAVGALASAYGLGGAAAGLLVGQAGGALAAIGWWRREPRAGAAGVDAARLREAARFGVKIWTASLAAIVVYRFDLFLLNGYAGSDEAGYYAVAIAVAAILAVLPGALGNVLVPRLAALGATGDDERRGSTEAQAIRHTVLLVGVTAAVLAVCVPLLVEPVFGSDFGPAVAPTLILLPGAAALGLATTLYSILAGRGRPDYAMWVAAVITPLAIGLYFLLIPEFEAEGAAIGSDIVYGISAAIAWVCLRRLGGPGLGEVVPGRAEVADYRVLALALRGR